jgi:phosphoglucomutase
LNEAESFPSLDVVYTPMHGVGWKFAAEIALKVNNCTLTPVSEQIDPDPDFPTVRFPNPEEDGALQLAFETADRAGGNTVIANDPDADRFAVAQKIDNSWQRFTGDQIGVLLADYLLENELRRNNQRKIVMLCSAVSSGMLKKMIDAAGSRFHFEETLTGFKWIGNRAKQLQDEGLLALFGYEEALGYMFPEVSWDKDGIAAMSTFLSALSYWRTQGLDPGEKLRRLYQVYGYHESINTYFISPSPNYTKEVFLKIRSSDAISRMSFGSYKIVKWRDVTKGTECGAWENKLPRDHTSEMLKFHLVEADSPATDKEAMDKVVDGMPTEILFTIRASGTEPKVKLYLECSSSSEDKAVHHATKMFSTILEGWISPLGQELRHSGRATSSSNRPINVVIS